MAESSGAKIKFTQKILMIQVGETHQDVIGLVVYDPCFVWMVDKQRSIHAQIHAQIKCK